MALIKQLLLLTMCIGFQFYMFPLKKFIAVQSSQTIGICERIIPVIVNI